MKPATTLYVSLSGKQLSHRLHAADQEIHALQGIPNKEISKDLLADVTESADKLLRAASHADFGSAAVKRGGELFATLVPAELMASLKRVQGPLMVSTALGAVQWEMLHDGEEFWGLRYALGRQMQTSRSDMPARLAASASASAARRKSARAAASAKPAGRKRALVIIADPFQDLPFVHDEGRRVGEALERQYDTEVLYAASYESATDKLLDRLEIIHFAGHVSAGSKVALPGLVIKDGERLIRSEWIQNIMGNTERPHRSAPLVFINGCSSAHGQSGEAVKSWDEATRSIADAFLLAGAIGVVGTLCDVTDEHATTLAVHFYNQLLGGAAVGEALRCARLTTRKAHPGSAAWLSFALFGNPTLTLALPAAPRAPRLPRVPAPAAALPAHALAPGLAPGPAPGLAPGPAATREPARAAAPSSPATPSRPRLFDALGTLDSRQASAPVASALQQAVLDTKALGHERCGPQALAIACLGSEAVMRATRGWAANALEQRRALYALLEGEPQLPAPAPTHRAVRLADFSPAAQQVLAAAGSAGAGAVAWPALLAALRQSPELAASPLLEPIDRALAAQTDTSAIEGPQEDMR